MILSKRSNYNKQILKLYITIYTILIELTIIKANLIRTLYAKNKNYVNKATL